MKRRIRPFPLALLLVILALVGCFIGFTLKTQQVNANFHYNAAYEDLNLNRPKSVFQRLGEDGYDLTMPGLSGPVTFTSPCNFSFFQDFKEHDVKKGDTLTFDFVTYSRGYVYTAARSGVFTVNGQEYATMLPLRATVSLYIAALEQNDLVGQFESDFGAPLSRKTAHESLRKLDRQLYETGVYNPTDYPFDKLFWNLMLKIAAVTAPVSMIILGLLAAFLLEGAEYRRYLSQNNRENQARWDTVSGTLPEFHSLSESGSSTAPKPMLKKPGLKDALYRLFGPTVKR
mgnify:CR=1 FL=1